jgi:hypothetical protein
MAANFIVSEMSLIALLPINLQFLSLIKNLETPNIYPDTRSYQLTGNGCTTMNDLLWQLVVYYPDK